MRCYKNTKFDFLPTDFFLSMNYLPKVPQIQGESSETPEGQEVVVILCYMDSDKKNLEISMRSRSIGTNDGARLCLLMFELSLAPEDRNKIATLLDYCRTHNHTCETDNGYLTKIDELEERIRAIERDRR